jgi:hypothetical protein
VDVFGSFALLLAFVCAAYAVIGGIAAIRTRHPLLVKSARQAGMATCVLIFLATFSLVYLFFTDSYWVSYVVSHSNRSLSTFYKIAALWSGQEGSLLFWSFLLAIYVFSVLIAYRNKNGELMPYVGVVMAGVQIFFLTLNNFVASPFKVLAAPGTHGTLDIFTRAESTVAVPGDGDSPAESVFGLHGIHDSVCLRTRRAAGAVSRREVDSPDAKVDDDRVVLSDRWDFAGRALGLRGAGVGRLLGLGPSGECFAAAVADGYGVSAFGDDAGKARHDEGMERVAGVRHLHAVHFGNDADAQRGGEFGACVRAIEYWKLVPGLSDFDSGGVFRGVCKESRLFEE